MTITIHTETIGTHTGTIEREKGSNLFRATITHPAGTRPGLATIDYQNTFATIKTAKAAIRRTMRKLEG